MSYLHDIIYWYISSNEQQTNILLRNFEFCPLNSMQCLMIFCLSGIYKKRVIFFGGGGGGNEPMVSFFS